MTGPAQEAWFKLPPRSGVASAWYGHVPFAFWLIEAARPQILVELGTQHGVSYAAFCEAVAAGGLPTACYAVDRWRGDERGYADFKTFHDARYAGFSRLLRTSFDAAAAYFADGSVDLLHVDGRHDDQTVRHVFETWRPKLSSRAVVLFHGIDVREPESGVWRLWAELRSAYPSFEFMHGQGLGVLGFGAELEGAVRALCSLDEAGAAATLRSRFAASGARAHLAAEQGRLQAEADAAARLEAERLDIIAVAQEVRAAEIRRRLARAERLLAAAESELSEARDTLVHKDIQIAHFRSFAEAYHALIGSTLWRALQPLRSLGAAIPSSLRRLLRHGGTAAWWAATPWRLRSRLAVRRERIALAHSPPLAPPPPPALPPPVVDRYSLDLITQPESGYVPMIRWLDPIAPEVSIVVLNWNGGDMTLLCLQHVWQHTTGHRYEVIVVDNGSDPNVDLKLLRQQVPFARIIELGTNRYFGEANNIGAEAARGRYVCFLNNDAFVPPGWLETLVEALESEADVGAVGPLFLYPNGSLQEAGALINRDGTVTQLGKGEAVDDPAFRVRRVVDYVSAACLLMRRDDFMRAYGFDLAWEPAYYEDVDLCLKLRLLGLKSIYCPDTAIIHFESATSSNRGVSLKLHNIVSINRAKFLGRWGTYLDGGEPPALLGREMSVRATPPREPRLSVLLFTPYQLTPGGGERYVLTIAEAFRDIAHVALVTPRPISRLRLLTMAREFGLALDQVELLGPEDLEDRLPADLAFVLGNEIFPTVGRLARHNVFICQFPFPFESEQEGRRRKALWHEFELVLIYSEYVRSHVLREAASWNTSYRPVEVLAPPVPMVWQTAPKRRGMILHVGRFFTGGHCKRQDRLIEAFRLLREQGVDAELHLAGSTMPDPQHRTYYTGLIEQAAGLPVHFHANCSNEMLQTLYAESDIYWHATGLGADAEAEPHAMEHFGISVVEAMSARCIAIVYGAGGPATIVTDGVTGYHYSTVAGLADRTRAVLQDMAAEAGDAMRTAAAAAAQAYDEATFRARVRSIADRVCAPPSPMLASAEAPTAG